MILVLDIGNTHIHMGLFTRGVLRSTWRLSTEIRRTDDEYALILRGMLGDHSSVEGGIVSSVVPPITQTLVRATERALHFTPMVLTAQTGIGLVNEYERPDEVGMDRLANAAGGNWMYGAPLLIIDFGTAVTLDYVAAPLRPGEPPRYRGGAIMPGIQMSARALYQGTSKLPLIDLTEPGRVIGRTTADSIRSGLVTGFLGGIAALVERAREETGEACRVVSTGGDAVDFKEKMPYVHAAEPNLTLYGLRLIYGLNNNCPLPKSPSAP